MEVALWVFLKNVLSKEMGTGLAHVVAKLVFQMKPRRAIVHAELGIATVSIPAWQLVRHAMDQAISTGLTRCAPLAVALAKYRPGNFFQKNEVPFSGRPLRRPYF